jgi:PAS domain S-box-containing protein
VPVQDHELAQIVIETVGALVVVLDRDARIVRWNAACEAATGYERDEVLGRPFWFLVPPEEREGVEGVFSKLVARDFPNRHRNHWMTRDGARRLVAWSNTALLDERGQVRLVIATGVDLTEQHRAEEALLRQAARLEALAEASRVFASGLDYKTTLDTVARRLSELIGDGALIRVISPDAGWLVPVAVYHPDPERAALRRRVIQQAPQRTNEGMTARVLQGRRTLRIPQLTLEMVHGEMKPEYWPYLEGVSSLMMAPLEHRRHVFGHITLMRDTGGAPYTPEDEALLEDLAHRAAQAIENARLYGEAQSAVAVRDEFLSIASHELRTPLTALRLALENMRRVASRDALEKLPAPYVERVLATAERQGQRLEKLVTGLLDVSRIHMGRLELDVEEVELGAAVQEALGAVEDEAAQSGSEIRVSGETVRGFWDRLRISQVVTNLLANAVKYGGGKPVEVEFSPRGDRAVLRVRDHGIGIDPADQPQIFERFERAVSSRNYGGLGLGLYIVKRIVEAHGGIITVESKPGEGATFQVELPQRPAVAVGGGDDLPRH